MPAPSDILACSLAGLSVYGAASLGHDLWRVARAGLRQGQSAAEWTAAKWRAYAMARDRHREWRRNGVERDLAAAVAELSRRVAVQETPATPPTPPTPVPQAAPTPRSHESLTEVVAPLPAPSPAPSPGWPDKSPLARYQRCVRYAAFQTRAKWTELAGVLDAAGHAREAADCRVRADWRPSPFQDRAMPEV